MQITVKISGPLFANPLQPIQKAVSRTVRELTVLAEERLRTQLVPRPTGLYKELPPAGTGTSTGWYRSHIKHAIKADSAIIDDSGVVYGPWLEVGDGRRFKGYAAFRRTTQWMERNSKEVLSANIKLLLRELGG